ncbi:GIY-YIG nuclease family protein [Guptibacillus spartinae]|uniref:GIY-YIG nuclease family protein n=1 Tax=Guptibacillus spartinae TaxID=3025679 RepID=UPI002360B854|nr:GIY-YIG nuclease family protein [Pseudalkalibacillus spartinae]
MESKKITGLLKRKEAGFVYFLREHLCGSIKIGYSRNLDQRLIRFGVTLPFDVELAHAIYSQNVQTTEKLLHKYFEGKRLNGEWFQLSEEELNEIRRMNFPEEIVKSITIDHAELETISVGEAENIKETTLSPTDPLFKEVLIAQINYKPLPSKPNPKKLKRYMEKMSNHPTETYVEVQEQKGKRQGKFLLVGSPYYILASQKLKRKSLLVKLVNL